MQALGGKLDLIASFGDQTLTVTTTEAPPITRFRSGANN